ncbi:aspartyl/asparaginyl beta-hydroxylase [Chloropicon primus]|uniref:Aspartyl/asparaginyl beta-hydroxylase n=1 Tax=Chloropicon primus TaxID=1764295 RepID=A0A5B8MKD9_9CHLO|nr:aspartyl/asparaginyl beta-hydroxylase [Chloropicon primus]UPQ99376.1 aspartyl/asparaginyl beta-hydroxylase [Chloropicon primus]|eukprot:QDZ20165.1 aspartyl/asparaginyl beta-hydroxylase [Chloropicon primus]
MAPSAVATLLYGVVYPVSAYILFRLVRFYVVERNDPWFWGDFGLGAPRSHKVIHFLLKCGALVVSNIPSGPRKALLRAVKQSKLFGDASALDFDFDNYDRIIKAPTVAKGAKAIGMRKLSEWLYRPRHFSTIESVYTHPYCRPILYIPGVRMKPFYPPRCKDFPWIEKLEAASSIIQEEFLRLSETNPKAVGTYLVPEDMTTKVEGWRTFFLVNPQGKQMVENQKLTPKTWEILNTIPGFIPSNMTMFSVLTPGAEILSHCGLTNAAVRVHLPIIVPESNKSVIRVGPKVRTWEEGKVLCFNDAYDHQVWQFGTKTRVVLFFDVWHPDLTPEDLEVIQESWDNIKLSMGKVADEYEKMSKKMIEADEMEKDDWLITEKPKTT